MPVERDFEDVLAKYPDMIEGGLRLIARQKVVCGRRMDLVFEDELKRTLIVELKAGPLKDEHIGQIISYEGTLLSSDRPDLRVMLIGTRVPPNLQRALDHHGIAWKEIKQSELLAVLKSKHDYDLACRFEAAESLAVVENESALKPVSQSPAGAPRATTGRRPALLALVRAEWLEQARNEMKAGKPEIYFGANSSLAQSFELPLQTVYFKLKGDTKISATAKLIGVTTQNPSTKRLNGNENLEAKFYYGFRDVRALDEPIPLSAVRYFNTGKPVPNAVPGACIVEELA